MHITAHNKLRILAARSRGKIPEHRDGAGKRRGRPFVARKGNGSRRLRLIARPLASSTKPTQRGLSGVDYA